MPLYLSTVLRVAVLSLAACGRLDFDPAPPAVVQTSSNGLMSTTTIQLALMQMTQAGDLIVVASDGWSPVSSITSITDDAGNTYVSANATSNLPAVPGGDTVEIWYATNALAGATQVTVAGSQTSHREAWLLEASSLSTLDAVAKLDSAPATTQPTAPQISPTVAPALIVAIGDFAATNNGLHAGSPFNQLQIWDSNDTVWLLTAQLGAYAAAWDTQTSNTYCISVAAFR